MTRRKSPEAYAVEGGLAAIRRRNPEHLAQAVACLRAAERTDLATDLLLLAMASAGYCAGERPTLPERRTAPSDRRRHKRKH